MYCCSCFPISNGVIGAIGSDNGLPDEVLRVIENIRNRGGNINGDVLFTFFWNNTTDLDMWVFLKDTDKFISYQNRSDTSEKVSKRIQGMSLDVDANASAINLTTTPIENIGIITSSNSPDGVYEVYLDNFKNRNSGQNYFNFLTMYRTDPDGEFDKVIWYRNTTSFDAPQGNGDKSIMLHVLDITKEGREYSITYKTNSLEKVFEFEYLENFN